MTGDAERREHGSVMSGARRARRSHASVALTVDPPPPTHRQSVKKQRAQRRIGDREGLVLTVLQSRPGAYASDLATATGLTVGQARYSLGILRELQIQRVQAAPRKAKRDRGERIARRYRLLEEARASLRRLEERRDAWVAGDLVTVYGDARIPAPVGAIVPRPTC
jgi:hypothetical protein